MSTSFLSKNYFGLLLILLCTSYFNTHAIAANTLSVAGGGNVVTTCPGMAGVVVYTIQMTEGTTANNIENITFTTSGTAAAAADITGYTVWANSSNTLTGATYMATITNAGAGIHTLLSSITASPYYYTLGAGTVNYLFITATFAGTAAPGHVLNIAAMGNTATNWTMSTASAAGGTSTATGSTTTIGSCSSNVVYAYTGSLQTFTVPAGCTSINAVVNGAQGGDGSSITSSGQGGAGGSVSATIAVTPGQVLQLYVGGKGTDGCSSCITVPEGGSNSGGGATGGNGSGGVFGEDGAGGGGASDIRTTAGSGTADLTTRIITAGGGGGATTEGAGNGGVGGHDALGASTGGGKGRRAHGASWTVVDGGPGTLAAGGAGGTGTFGAGSSGGLGFGGSGYNSYYGGGGGGGYYGAGGAYSGGACGGSSLAATIGTNTVSAVVYNDGAVAGNGSIIIVLPGITGPPTVCAGSTITLSNTLTGGSWSSSNVSVATIGSVTGIVTGVIAGTATITYLAPGPSVFTFLLTVNATSIAAISGLTTICTANTTALTDATTGGAWSSSAPATAIVDSSTGVVTGITSGTVIITYSNGCATTTIAVTVSAGPVVSGASPVCPGSSITLTSSPTGGTWVSGSTSIATVGSASGVVTGVATGTAAITYNLAAGCIATQVVTVNGMPPVISGPASVCMGSTITLSDSLSGGTWSSSNTAVATIGSTTGVVTPVSTGTVTISYANSCGFSVATMITVVSSPGAISGPTSVCAGSAITLSDVTSGGTWSSGSAGIATAGSLTGIVTGISAGVSNISYIAGGCAATLTISVNPSPGTVTITPPSATVCLGTGSAFTAGGGGVGTVLLSQNFNTGLTGAVGGTWTIVNTAGNTASYFQRTNPNGYQSSVAGDGSVYMEGAPGDLNGLTTTEFRSPVFSTSGMSSATLTYNESYEYYSTGDHNVQVDYSLNGGSTWAAVSGNYVGASVNSGGSFSATLFTAGTPQKTYSLPAGALGQPSVMLRWYYSSTFGYYWAVDNIVLSGPGTAASYTWTGISGAGGLSCSSCGTTTITPTTAGVNLYSVSVSTGGCAASAICTVNVKVAPTSIIGSGSVCIGSAIALSDAITGGTWSSSPAGTASVGSLTGIVTGVTSGTATITYTNSCGTATIVVTVNALPTVSGASSLCAGSSITLTPSPTGGTWVSGSTSIATVGSGSGTVTGVAAGTAAITYTDANACMAKQLITVNAVPSAISGTGIVCVGSAVTLSDTSPGGTWSSGSAGTATVGSSTGVVTGISSGTADITYSLATGCYAFLMVTVNATLPAAVTGPGTVCTGAAVTMNDATPGGVWSCSPGTVASIGSTGNLSGIAAGTATVTYEVAGCAATTSVMVDGLQVPQICVVTVDSASGKNLVVWSQFTPNHIEQFNIYRENSSSIFVKIDSQESNVFSTYLDTGSYPVLQSYSYQLTAIDSCGSETPLDSSTIHTTVHLSANLGVGGVINLSWNTYVGAAVTTQNIMRSAGGAPYVNIASVANTVTSYTDATPPSGALLYEVNSVMASACSPSARVTSEAYIVSSNAARILSTTEIDMPGSSPSVHIFPNPATDELTIIMNAGAYSLFTITNSIGQQMVRQQINSAQTTVDIKTLPDGVYYITLSGDKGTREQKFVKL